MFLMCSGSSFHKVTPLYVKDRLNLVNPFTTIHDGNFRRHSSMYVTIHDGNFRRIYYSYTKIPGSWYALRPGSEEVNLGCLRYKCARFACLVE